MNVVVISNAAASRARRHVVALREALPEQPGHGAVAARSDLGSAAVRHHLTERPEQVTALVAHPRWQPDDLLVLNGGDGSVQHALSALIAGCPAERRPRVACLPGGTTNMTAFDLNRHRRFPGCLDTLRRAVQHGGGAPAPRAVVRVNGGGSDTARCGLFFGAGTIVQGIEYFQARIRHNGGAHELGAGAALARALWGIARRQPPFDAPLDADVDVRPAHGDAFRLPGPVPVRLLLVTTLDRLFLGMRPYWGGGHGSLKCTLVEARATPFMTRVPRLLRGRPDAQMTPDGGWHSARLDAVSLAFHGSYTLDGELFADAGDTIRLSATEPVRFLRL